MRIKWADNLVCPLDGLSLEIIDKHYRCSKGHCFDIARQGYTNLLPVQFKRSKNPGDSKEMVAARTAFLETGVYAPIAEKLSALVIELTGRPVQAPVCILDAGCGEGYYLTQLLTSLQQSPIVNSASFIGMDISKPAILAACKRSRQVTWLVASSKQPPLQAASVDIILSMFGFPVYDRFKEILKTDGRIILVEAGASHLIELRKLIYPEVRLSEPPALDAALVQGLSLSKELKLQYQTPALTNIQINNLLLMTPHFFRINKQAQRLVEQLESITLTVDINYRVLESA